MPVATEVLTCTRCGFDWTRERKRGRKPQLCPACLTVERAPRPEPCAPNAGTGHAHRLDTESPGYRLAHAVTVYRLAIEEAACALRLGRNREALAALDRVDAPTRRGDRRGRIHQQP